MGLNAKPLIRASIVVIMLFQVAALFARSYLQIELVEFGFDTTVAKHLSYFVVPVILLALMAPILWQNKNYLLGLFCRPESWPKMLMACVTLGLSLRVAWWATMFAASLFGWFDKAAPGQGSDLSFYVACPPTYVFLLAVVVMAILTPMEEEIVHRGLILGALSRKDPRVAVAISALLFAVVHNQSGMPNAFIMGLFLAIQLIRYRTLWAPIITHGAYNLLTILDWDCLHVTWLPSEPAAGTIFFGAMVMLVDLACLTVAIWIVAYVRAGAEQSPRPQSFNSD